MDESTWCQKKHKSTNQQSSLFLRIFEIKSIIPLQHCIWSGILPSYETPTAPGLRTVVFLDWCLPPEPSHLDPANASLHYSKGPPKSLWPDLVDATEVREFPVSAHSLCLATSDFLTDLACCRRPLPVWDRRSLDSTGAQRFGGFSPGDVPY